MKIPTKKGPIFGANNFGGRQCWTCKHCNKNDVCTSTKSEKYNQKVDVNNFGCICHEYGR